MTIQELWGMPGWKLSCYTFCIQILIFVKARWHRRETTWFGVANYAWRITLHITLILLSMCVLRQRFMLFGSVYSWPRLVDDIADGDEAPPKNEDIEFYLDQKRVLVDSISVPWLSTDRILREDVLLVHIMF